MALTKDDITNTLVERFSLKRREASDLLTTFLDDLKNELTQNEKARLPGFGLLYRAEQPYTLKRTDIEDDLPPWNVIKFKPAVPLMKRIQRALIEESRDVD
jgi:nucleoid DNA-binding protein